MTLTKLTTIGAAALAILFAASSFDGVARVFSSVARAETIFFDDFSDGDATDGNPVTWSPHPDFPYNDGTYNASSGDFVLTPSANNSVWLMAGVLDPPLSLRDVSIRSQIRAGSDNNGISLLARGAVDAGSYLAAIHGDGALRITYLERTPGSPDSSTTLVTTTTGLRPIVEDVILQFDVIGENLDLYAWRPGEPQPVLPQLQATSDRFTEGSVGVAYSPSAAGHGSATFRYVHVATSPIPEPSTATLSVIFVAGLVAWRWRLLS